MFAAQESKPISTISLNCRFLNSVKRKVSSMDKINWYFFFLYGHKHEAESKFSKGLKSKWMRSRTSMFWAHWVTLFHCKFSRFQNTNAYNTISWCELTIVRSHGFRFKRERDHGHLQTPVFKEIIFIYSSISLTIMQFLEKLFLMEKKKRKNNSKVWNTLIMFV